MSYRLVYNKNHTLKNEKIFNTQQFRLRLEQIHGNLKALQTSIIIFFTMPTNLKKLGLHINIDSDI